MTARDDFAVLLRYHERRMNAERRAIRRFDRHLRRILRLRPRNPLAALIAAHEEHIDTERRKFATAVVDAIKATQTREGQVFDQFAYMRIQHTLRPLYDEFYGAFPGDQRARFWRLMLDECRAARGLAFQGAVQDVRRRLRTAPDLIRTLKEAA